jgi:hypothetical protein
MAWLHARPKHQTANRLGVQPNNQLRSRLQQFRESGTQPKLPPVKEEGYLTHYWAELGFASFSAGYWEQFAPANIESWARVTALPLLPWEFKALLSMSAAYASQLVLSEKPHCPPPFGSHTDYVDRDSVAKQFEQMFRSMSKRKK